MPTVTVTPTRATRIVHVPAYGASLVGELTRPRSPRGLVIVAELADVTAVHVGDHNIARELQDAGFATLLLNLLTADEGLLERATGRVAIDLGLLSRRLIETIDWAIEQQSLNGLPIGLFATGTAAAAAVVASVIDHACIGAIVSSGGWLTLAGPVLSRLTTPTLLIAAGNDPAETRANEMSYRRINGCKEMVLVDGTTSRFGDAAGVEQVARHTLDWFDRHLATRRRTAEQTERDS